MKTDTQLQHDVLSELEWEPSIDASQIGVAAKDGVVTLTGTAVSYAAKMTAERVAKRVYGVKAVANDIAVRLPGTSQRNDADIAAAVVSALKWDASLPEGRIKVTVRDGWVTLDGTIDWGFQRDSAERLVRHLTGVKGVSNDITFTARVRPGDVKEKIEAAFKRSAEVDARRVSVATQDGKVVLSGHVRSWAEREAAEQAAWAAPGVTAVESHLTVLP
jgi:osmotically-inducible protein OsmY